MRNRASTGIRTACWVGAALLVLGGAAAGVKAGSHVSDPPKVVRSVADGAWSDPATWDAERAPGAGGTVLIREGHTVVYDVESAEVLRAVHISGTLRFADDRDTRLEAGLIRVQAGNSVSEEGFDCSMPLARDADDAEADRPALLVGTPAAPIPKAHSARIRLHFFEGMNPESLPAIVCCGGRMEFHGAPLSRTWVKLEQTAHRGERVVLLPFEVVGDWSAGDQVILTGTTRQFGYKDSRTSSVAEAPTTERRTIKDVRGHPEFEVALVTLDEPLEHDHYAKGRYRAEVANLSRNVVVESADPDGARGHTMYHRHSAGSIRYAEFRHLGKKGVLGRYSLHFHLVGDTMRGSSVVGASIWDSHNRWITIHGTNYLVVRDCVGYRSLGHGFFLEDGTEAYNVLDGNLAVQALRFKPLPDQALPFDGNLGSGFWWANSLNSFTNNVAVECDQDGYRFEVVARDGFDPVLPVLQPDGSRQEVDIRTLPFLRFTGNEAHCQRFYGLNLGGTSFGGVPPYHAYEGPQTFVDVDGVGPDPSDPFVIRDFTVWNSHWAFHTGAPAVLAERVTFHDCEYGIWRCVMDHHEYRDLEITEAQTSAIFYPRPGRAGSAEMAYLDVEDRRPPVTVVTRAVVNAAGALVVEGTSVDNDAVARVVVNGREARPTRPDFGAWTLTLTDWPEDGPVIRAFAEDTAGNVEPRPHELSRSSLFSEPRAAARTPSTAAPSGTD